MSKSSKQVDGIPENIWLLPAAEAELRRLDRNEQIRCGRALVKVSESPSQFGSPLENRPGTQLAGFRKLKVGRLRIVYRVVATDRIEVTVIVTVGRREGLEVYQTAHGRREALEQFVEEALKKLVADTDKK